MTKEVLEKGRLLSLRIEAIELTLPDLQKSGVKVGVHNGNPIPKELIGAVGSKALSELTITFLKKQLELFKTEFEAL